MAAVISKDYLSHPSLQDKAKQKFLGQAGSGFLSLFSYCWDIGFCFPPKVF